MMMRLVLLLLTLLVLPGCSAIKIAYNQADVVAAWKADDYFDLDAQQKERLRGNLGRFHAWHRSTQLADYADVLDAALKRVQAGLSEQDATWIRDAINQRYRTLVLRGYEDAARMLATLSDAQLAATRHQFDKDNRKFAREHGAGRPPDEQRRLRAQRQIERIEHWTGPLTAAQEARLRELSRALPLITDLRQQDRIRRQQEFLALLAERRSPAFAPKLRAWLLDWERTRTPEYDAQLARFVEASARLYVEAFASFNAEQRNHVAERLRRYAVALRELARDGERSAEAPRS